MKKQSVAPELRDSVHFKLKMHSLPPVLFKQVHGLVFMPVRVRFFRIIEGQLREEQL